MEAFDSVAARAGDDLLPGYPMAAQEMNSGICQGGPLHGYANHHPEASHQLAVDQHTKRAIPGMVASADPYIKFGTYRFADGIWTWTE